MSYLICREDAVKDRIKLLVIWLIMYVVTIGLGGCSAFQPHVDEELAPYVQNFETVAHKKNTASVRFAETPYSWSVGYCNLGQVGRREVLIDAKFWKTATQDQKERLLLHELGHCVLGLGHSTDRKSVMFPSL